MEEFPRVQPERPEDGPDENPNRKKKRRKRGGRVPLSQIASLQETKVEAPAKPDAKSLAELLLSKDEKPEKSEQTKKPEKPEKTDETKKVPGEVAQQEGEAEGLHAESPEAASSISQQEHGASEASQDDEPETYEALPGYEPQPVEFSGGEVIIHLNGEAPVTERVIPLHEQADQATEMPVAESDAEPATEQVAEVFPAASATTPAFEAFTRQQEQQHQAHDDAPEAVPAAEFAARSQESPQQSPEAVQPRSEDVYDVPEPVMAQANIAPAATGSERPATKREVEDAIYYATKAGQGRGVATGLVVGGAYEHFKHKRREKRAEKRFKKQTKQLEQARQDYKFGAQEQNRQQAEAARQSTTTEQRFTAASQGINRTQAERLQNSRNPEQAKQAPLSAQLEQGEQPAIPEDHRLESSAWHSIEIDSRTGKPVENPTFSYGHEYYRERAPENTPIAQRNAAAGEVALVAAASAAASAAGDDAAVQQPAAQIPDASMRGQTPSRPKASSSTSTNLKENAKSALDSFKNSSTNTGPLWPWLLALGVIFILLVVLLR